MTVDHCEALPQKNQRPFCAWVRIFGGIGFSIGGCYGYFHVVKFDAAGLSLMAIIGGTVMALWGYYETLRRQSGLLWGYYEALQRHPGPRPRLVLPTIVVLAFFCFISSDLGRIKMLYSSALEQERITAELQAQRRNQGADRIGANTGLQSSHSDSIFGNCRGL